MIQRNARHIRRSGIERTLLSALALFAAVVGLTAPAPAATFQFQDFGTLIFPGTPPNTFSSGESGSVFAADMDGSGIDVTLTWEDILNGSDQTRIAVWEDFESEPIGDPNVDSSIREPFALRFTNARDGSTPAALSGATVTISFSTQVFLAGLTLNSFSTFGGVAEVGLFQAFDGPNGTGNGVFASSVTENGNGVEEPEDLVEVSLFGSGYRIKGLQPQAGVKFGEVMFDFSSPVQSFSFNVFTEDAGGNPTDIWGSWIIENGFQFNRELSPVPEPGTLWLMLLGGSTFALGRKFRRRS